MRALLTEIISIAINAGTAIMEVYNEPFDVTTKADNSPLTKADLAADKVIKDGITRLQTGWPILSEESSDIRYSERKNWDRFWLVDPLDGTKEFIKRNGEFTVNIALIEHGKPVLGVVYAPVLGTCYYGAYQIGSYVSHDGKFEYDKPIHVETYESGPIRVVASRSHLDARVEALLETFNEYNWISMGSSLKLCLVAQGAAHLYPRIGPTMEWDTAAAHAIVSQAGGTVCDFDGKELVYNKPDMHNPNFMVISRMYHPDPLDEYVIDYFKQTQSVI